MNDEELLAELKNYCAKYFVPEEFLFEILEDQKVIPMIRGKALEYNGYIKLKDVMNSRVWDVQKLNLNAQTGHGDEDISVTHRRSGVILKIECKSGVRGSISSGLRAKICKEPHFRVKSHRSRSNISKASTSNDRYPIDEFDVILTTTENAIYQGATVGEDLELIYNESAQQALRNHYDCESTEDIIQSAINDWRYCIPEDIGEDGYVPRTPIVKLNNDPNWRPLNELEDRLQEIVAEKVRNRNQTGRR